MEAVAARLSRAPPADPCRPVALPSAGALQVERVDVSALESLAVAWTDLARRAIEPNVFLEPGFALPLLRHIGPTKRLGFLLVWEDTGPTAFTRLVGLVPVAQPRGPLKFGGIARGWTHNQVCSGVPLVDGDRAAEVLDAILARLEDDGGAFSLVLTLVPRDGAFFAVLQDACARSSRGFTVTDEHPRAFLQHEGGAARAAAFLSAKRRKEYARLSRKLTALGARAYSSATTPPDVALAAEGFLALEHAGWKGGTATSFLSDPGRTAFFRAAVLGLAVDGKCRIDSLEIDGRPVAMGVVLATGDRAYYWKTAFDESHASLSPGVLLTLDLTQRQLIDPGLASTDSCAIADHPMIDRIWPDRLGVCDLMVGTCRGDSRKFRRSLRVEAIRRGLRQRAKVALQRFRRLRGR